MLQRFASTTEHESRLRCGVRALAWFRDACNACSWPMCARLGQLLQSRHAAWRAARAAVEHCLERA